MPLVIFTSIPNQYSQSNMESGRVRYIVVHLVSNESPMIQTTFSWTHQMDFVEDTVAYSFQH